MSTEVFSPIMGLFILGIDADYAPEDCEPPPGTNQQINKQSRNLQNYYFLKHIRPPPFDFP